MVTDANAIGMAQPISNKLIKLAIGKCTFKLNKILACQLSRNSQQAKTSIIQQYAIMCSLAGVACRALISYVAVKQLGSCVKRNKKFLFFMYFLNTYTRNSDYLILFIKTNDAHKISMLSHTISNTFKKYNRGRGRGKGDGNIVKNDGGDEMVVVFTITETNCLVVSLFFDLVRAILYLYLWC